MLTKTASAAILLVCLMAQAVFCAPAPPITTSHVVLSGSSFSTQPLSVASAQRIKSLSTLAATTLASRAQLCPVKPVKCPVVLLNPAKASKSATIAKGSTILTVVKQAAVTKATVIIQDAATLILPPRTSLTFTFTSLKLVSNSWLLASDAALKFSSGLWTTTARLFRPVNSTVQIASASVKFTDTLIWSTASAWTLTGSETEFAWSAPKPTVPASASKPFLLDNSVLTVNQGILKFTNLADAVITRSNLNFITCNVELVNTQLTIIDSQVNFGGNINKLTNSKLTLVNVVLTGDKYLRNVFKVPLKVQGPPFVALDKIKPFTFTVATGNFSVQSKPTF